MRDGSPPSGRRSRVRRYPGVRSFEDDPTEQALFYGRQDDTYELAQLVRAERLVVLFARSGVGKSSLINAGLMPELREKGFFPFVARVANVEKDPLDSFYRGVRAACERAVERDDIEMCEPSDPAEWNRSSLWHFFKSFYVWRGESELLTPVVIFDQFEELFTLLAEAKRRPFIEELADLVRGARPGDSVEERRLNESTLGGRPPNVRVVLAIREDFMAHLEEMAERIPGILKARFRLGPLEGDDAELAIVEPARVESPALETDPFEWSREALDRVLSFLRRRKKGDGGWELGDEVEPFQLQLVCQHVEGLARRGKLSSIESDDIGGDEALRRILTEFYRDVIDDICDQFGHRGLERRLRIFCEDGLLTATGRRLLREESTIGEEHGLSADILAELVDRRLLRKERRLGDNYYELTHDTLIEPILASRQQRERKKRRLAVGMGVVALVFLVIGAGLTIRSQATLAEAARQSRIDELVDNGRTWGERRQFELAVAFYNAAVELDEGQADGLPRNAAEEERQVVGALLSDTAGARKEASQAIDRAKAVFVDGRTERPNSMDPDDVSDMLVPLLETGEALAAKRQAAWADSVFREAEVLKGRVQNRVDSLLSAGDMSRATVDSLDLDSSSLDVRGRQLDIASTLAQAAYAEEALEMYHAFQERHPENTIPAEFWNSICWNGGLFGDDPARVRGACENAVRLADSVSMGAVRDSRGLVLSLIGDSLELAREDFAAYADWGRGTNAVGLRRRGPQQIERREAWVRDLEKGRNPITQGATLDSLRREERGSRDRARLRLVNRYVPPIDPEQSLILLMREWTSDPSVLEHVRGPPAALCNGASEEAVARCDSLWAEATLPGMERIAENPCSNRLKELVGPAFVKELFITDTVGFNLCMSHPTSDYFQADEDWWTDARIWEVEPTRVARSDWDRDQSAGGQLYYVVYASVNDPSSDEFLGVMKAVFDDAVGRWAGPRARRVSTRR